MNHQNQKRKKEGDRRKMNKEKLHFKINFDWIITEGLIDIEIFSLYIQHDIGWIVILGICLYWEKY